MKTALRCVLPAAMMLGLSGCLTVYKLPAGAPYATVKVPPGNSNWICANGPVQKLESARDGRARVPAGQRITLGTSLYTSDGYMNYSCSAGISLRPEAKGEYYQDFQTEGQRCQTMVYRVTDEPRVGLEFEPTLGYSGDGCVRR